MPASIWGSLDEHFPIKQTYAFLNHAAVAPLPTMAAEAVMQTAGEQRDHGTAVYPSWQRRLRQARESMARLMGTEACHVAFVKNTTSGLIIAAEGIPWREGDNVVISSVEFPANVYPWLNLGRRGVQTRMVDPVEGRIRLQDIEQAMDERTRAVSLSWVQYANGFRADLGALSELCHTKGAYLVVDAIQGLGAIPLDIGGLGIDFLAADGHKWMLSVEGCGVLYVSPRALEQMDPVNIGWLSVDNADDYGSHDFRLRQDAARFEEGTHNMIGVHALGASADVILQAGVEAVWERIKGLTGRLAEGLHGLGCDVLSPPGEHERSGIISFRSQKAASADLVGRLVAAGVIVAERNQAVRVSPHFYNDESEIDRLLEGVRQTPRRH